jgi:hypothetical protein
MRSVPHKPSFDAQIGKENWTAGQQLCHHGKTDIFALGLQVQVDHPGMVKRTYVLDSLSEGSTSSEVFELNGRRITVAEYHQQKNGALYGPMFLH